MKKHLKIIAFILMSLPVLVLGSGIVYSMFCEEPLGTLLLSSMVAGMVLYFNLPNE